LGKGFFIFKRQKELNNLLKITSRYKEVIFLKTAVILALSGILAGFVNGFFGTGGGLVIFYTLSYLGCDTRRSLASANFAILILSVLSFFLYIKTGALSYGSAKEFFRTDLLFALAGGAIGAYLSGKVSPRLLKKLFSALVIFCGAKMVLS
jgi:uncharacterized membrane protein YfcA